jgi:hypothetical protein
VIGASPAASATSTSRQIARLNGRSRDVRRMGQLLLQGRCYPDRQAH